MSEYYGITYSDTELSHYGVRGMRWGVRKAIKNKDNRALSKHYKKAQKKLEKLYRQANIDNQYYAMQKHNRRAKIGLGIGVAGAGAVGGISLARYLKNQKLANTKNTPVIGSTKQGARKKRILGDGYGVEAHGTGLNTGKVKEKVSNGPNNLLLKDKRLIPAAIGAAGLATAAYQKGKALAARRRLTSKGHAKAVTKRDNFEREMREAFYGTPYEDLPDRRRKRR